MYLLEGTKEIQSFPVFILKPKPYWKQLLKAVGSKRTVISMIFQVTGEYTDYNIVHMCICVCIYRYSWKYGDNSWESIFKSDMPFHMKFTFRDRVLVLECHKIELIVSYL